MKNVFKQIKREIKKQIQSGLTPQQVYENISKAYDVTDSAARFLHRRIAQLIKCMVMPENRKEYGFSYHLYIISLFIALIFTILSKQNRIEVLGLTSITSVSQLLAFFSINLYAWIYLVLAIKSLRFNLKAAYWALFFSCVDMIRLAITFPTHWMETPFFAVFRIVPPCLVFLFGVFYAINCANPYKKDSKTGIITFYQPKRKYHLDLRWKKTEDKHALNTNEKTE